MPESVEIPAPVNTVTRAASRSHPATWSMRPSCRTPVADVERAASPALDDRDVVGGEVARVDEERVASVSRPEMRTGVLVLLIVTQRVDREGAVVQRQMNNA